MLILQLFAWASLALGQDCETPLGLNTLLKGLDNAEAAIVSGNDDEAEQLAETLYDRILCLRDQIHPRHLVRYGRVRALVAQRQGDESDALYWGQLAVLDRSVRWPEGMPDGSDAREKLDMMGRRAPTLLEQRGLDVPSGGAVLVDGTLVDRPRASADAPHLVQLIDGDGRVYDTMWQDGTIWRESLLDYDPSPVPVPARYAAPNPQLDPYAPVALTAREAERRQTERMEAEAARAQTESTLTAALALEATAARKRRKTPLAERPAADPMDGASIGAPVPIYIEDDGRTDPLDRRVDLQLCRELLRLEARAMVGRLSDDQLSCLRTRMATAERQTTRARISRALLADSWAKGDTSRWEATLVRHLEQIDRSDATLSLMLSTWFADPERGKYETAIRWAGVARRNAHQWEGTLRVNRLSSLHRIDTMSASALWLESEAMVLEGASEERERKAAYWRDQTKTFAREWLQFALAASLDPREAFEVCLSASGTAEYCEVF